MAVFISLWFKSFLLLDNPSTNKNDVVSGKKSMAEV